MTTSGIIYITAGKTYTEDACHAAESARAANPGLGIDLFCDDPSIVPEGLFDKVHRIETPHRRSKVDCLHLSRFDRTLYLDSDTRVVTDLSDLFRVLERFDLAVCHAHARERKKTNAIWKTDIPSAFPQLNGGVLLYRRSPEVDAFLQDWASTFAEAGFGKDQVTLRELFWHTDLRWFVLPPEYNIRYAKYLDVWDPEEAQPKIKHFAEYNQMSAQKRKAKKKQGVLGRLFGR
ncbi:Glycosyl transferase family 8 [Roseivivax jejudonensis]|uniref:Glycosyl transferase family 8 n=1 Tax=Roseivivax jejudonensis TaxID=1529041 RepID=A0A1X6Z222_9RHOB|nr:hypothetical protein [Roseivivax jejudonensis]SLN38482.1 Glycosyl transferase family 8 [Roseivivax jejudonensis]